MVGKATISGRGRKPKPRELGPQNRSPLKNIIVCGGTDFSDVVNIDPPIYFDGLEFATIIWKSVVPELLKNRVLKITDMHNVEMFCIAYENMRQAQKEISQNGITVEGATGGPIKNPAVTTLNEASRQMIQFGSMLGLDPSSRTRLTGASPKESNTNPFANL